VPSCRSKRQCWAYCTFVSFETPTLGSVHLTSTLVLLHLRSIQNVGFAGLRIVHHAGVRFRAPHVGARFSTPSCHSTCELWIFSAHVVDTFASSNMSGLCSPDVFEVGPVLVALTSGEWW
jgi:hypothetical protein